jgi:biotin synthase
VGRYKFKYGCLLLFWEKKMSVDLVSATAEPVEIELRHDWQLAEVQALFNKPFNDLLFQAQMIHRQHFDPNEIQVSSLLSIKTGSCSEDCGYCPQSVRYQTEVESEALMPIDQVLASAQKAKDQVASPFCKGAAWRRPKHNFHNPDV